MTLNLEARQPVNWILCFILVCGLAWSRAAYSQESAPDAGVAEPTTETAVEIPSAPESASPSENGEPATSSLNDLLAAPGVEDAAAPAEVTAEPDAQPLAEAPAPEPAAVEAAEETSALDALLAAPVDEPAPEATEAPVAETPAVVVEEEDPALEPSEAEVAPDGDAARFATQEIVKRQERDEQGRRLFSEAEKLYQDGTFKAAADKYDEALKEMTDRAENDTFKTQGRDRAATAYLELAQRAYDRGNWDDARKHALEAKTRKPGLSAAADSLVRRCDRKAERESRISKIPTNVADRPEVLEQQKQIETLFDEARRWYAVEELDKAETLFESILLKDPYHRDAMRFLRRIEEKKLAARTTHREATVAKMVQEVRNAWNPPIRATSAGSGEQQQGTVDSQGAGQRALREKMEAITIPSIEFRQANVTDVILFLQQASIANDTSGSGVSFIMKLGAGGTAATPAATDSSDPWATPSTEGGATPDSAPVSSSPSITLNLRRVTLLDAVKYITELANLRFRIEEYAVIIVPMDAVIDQMVTRFYPVMPSIQEITIDKGENAEADFTQVDAGLVSSGTSIVRKNDMQSFFERMGVKFPPGSSITYNATISQLIVNNTPENLDKLEAILPEINLIPSQVEIEARFVEVNQQDMEELGLEWLLTDSWQIASKDSGGPAMADPRIQVNQNAVGSGTLGITKGLRFLTQTSTDPDPTPQSRTSGNASSMLGGILSLSGILTNPELNVVLHALDTSGGLDLLSAPRITTKSGNPAQIQVVKEILYPTEFEQQDIGAVEFTQVNITDQVLRRPPIPSQFEKRGVGIILNATPTVGPDGYTIDLTLTPEIAELVEWVNYGPPGEYPIYQPIFASRNVNTAIVLWDGQTVVMGGLLKEDASRMDDRIPLLGDVPVLGRLFRVEGEYSSKKNLMVFVTARLVDPSGKAIRTAEVSIPTGERAK